MDLSAAHCVPMVHFEPAAGVQSSVSRRRKARSFPPLTHSAFCWQPETDAGDPFEQHDHSIPASPTASSSSTHPTDDFCRMSVNHSRVSNPRGGRRQQKNMQGSAHSNPDSCGGGTHGTNIRQSNISSQSNGSDPRLSVLRTSVGGHRRYEQF